MVDIELTEEERRNGWTEETLQAYVAEREKAQATAVLDRQPSRPRWANSLYSPMRWRG